MIVREVVAAGVSVAVTFEVRAERVPAGAVSVVGDFNGWDPLIDPLRRDGDGWCRATVVMSPGRYRFRYLAESDHWFDEEAADAYEPNGHGGHDAVLVLDLTGIADTEAPQEAPVEAPAQVEAKPVRKAKEKSTEPTEKRPRKLKEPAAGAPEKPVRRARKEPAEAAEKAPRKARKESDEPKAKPVRKAKEKPVGPAE